MSSRYWNITDKWSLYNPEGKLERSNCLFLTHCGAVIANWVYFELHPIGIKCGRCHTILDKETVNKIKFIVESCDS